MFAGMFAGRCGCMRMHVDACGCVCVDTFVLCMDDMCLRVSLCVFVCVWVFVCVCVCVFV